MPINTTIYPFDPTGALVSNKVTDELQILTPSNGVNYHLAVPDFGPFFAESLVVSITEVNGTVRNLVQGIDYIPTHLFISASRACALQVYGSISFLNLSLAGIVKLTYQTVGGMWVIDANTIATILSDTLRNPRITAWEEVTSYPVSFPPIPHEWDLVDMVGMKEVVTSINGIESAILQQIAAVSAAMATKINGYTTQETDAMLANFAAALTNTINASVATALNNMSNTVNAAIAAEATARIASETAIANQIASMDIIGADEILFLSSN